jgi:hypothetical protein
MTATRYFVEETLRFAADHSTEIRELTAWVDTESIVGERLAVRATLERSPEPVEILLGGVTEEVNPYSGAIMRRRTDDIRVERMWEFGSFGGTDWEIAPQVYYVPVESTEVLRTLQAHGVQTRTVDAARPGPTLTLERFRLESVALGANPFEGRVEQTVEGEWEPAGFPLPAGFVEVPVDQPLGRLVFALLEPRSDDGLAHWGFFELEVGGGSHFPVLRSR